MEEDKKQSPEKKEVKSQSIGDSLYKVILFQLLQWLLRENKRIADTEEYSQDIIKGEPPSKVDKFYEQVNRALKGAY